MCLSGTHAAVAATPLLVLRKHSPLGLQPFAPSVRVRPFCGRLSRFHPRFRLAAAHARRRAVLAHAHARPARDSQPDHYSHAFFSPAFWSLAHSCFGPPSRLGKASPPHTSHAHAILLAIGKWGTCLLFRSRQSLQCRAYDLQPSFFGGAVATHTLAASMTQCPTSRQGCVRRTRCARFCVPSSHARNRSLFTPSCFPCRNACPTHKTPSATHAWPCFCHT